MPRPPFSISRPWRRQGSRARSLRGDRVWYDPMTDREYAQDRRHGVDLWHEIDYRRNCYRDVNPVTGEPISGSEGDWRLLQ